MSQENVDKVRAHLATWDREVLRPESRPFERINSTEAAVRLSTLPTPSMRTQSCPTTLARRTAASTASFAPEKRGSMVSSG